MKNNVIDSKKFKAEIYNGMEVVCGTRFAKKDEAIASVKRIINHQKSIDPNFTAYAMVWDNKKMIYYID